MVTGRDPWRLVLGVGIAACLVWAAVEARGIPRGSRAGPAPAAADPQAVEGEYRPILDREKAGHLEEALLALRDRAKRGPHPGYALFLLGEAAYREAAYGAALRHYRDAVRVEPAVGDEGGAFDSGKVLRERLRVLSTLVRRGAGDQELADLHYLRRRLSGGCE